MKLIWSSVAPGVLALLGFWFGVWLARRRRVTNDPVSRQWLRQNRYARDGDDRLWK